MSDKWQVETRLDSIGRPWVKCFYCYHWLPAWGSRPYNRVETASEEETHLRQVMKWCRFCRKTLDKAVTLWKEGKYDEARMLSATKLSVDMEIEFARRCREL